MTHSEGDSNIIGSHCLAWRDNVWMDQHALYTDKQTHINEISLGKGPPWSQQRSILL